MANRTIRVDYIARVEGESSLELHVRNGAVDAVRLSIFEPPRFFEALLRGRGYEEVLDIVARICGICPIAYQMSGVHAVEKRARH
jgi:coenzyme F420-reducing hydrogenase alpha subunit